MAFRCRIFLDTILVPQDRHPRAWPNDVGLADYADYLWVFHEGEVILRLRGLVNEVFSHRPHTVEAKFIFEIHEIPSCQ